MILAGTPKVALVTITDSSPIPCRMDPLNSPLVVWNRPVPRPETFLDVKVIYIVS